MKKWLASVSFLFMVFSVTSANAAPGSLDATFGVNGKAITSIGTNLRAVANAVAVQADGKIVAAGHSLIGIPTNRNEDFAVVRYNADGTLDTSFGGGTGIVTTDLAGFTDVAWAVVIQPDGKIVVTGEAEVDPNISKTAFAIARYNSDGSLDTSFDGDGISIVVVGVRSKAFAMTLQSDGKIVVAGNSTSANGQPISATVVRLNSNGSLDTTFDADGISGTQVGASDDIRTVAIQSDGKILIAGYTVSGTVDMAVVRFNANGSLDSSFDGDGIVTTAIGTSTEYIQSLAIQRDGKIVGAGASVVGATYHSALVRYNTNGSLDTSFDSDGIIVAPGGYQYKSVAIQDNNKIVAAGSAPGSFIAEIVRYKPDGSLDTAGRFRWDPTGIVTTSISYIGGVLIQPNGKVLAAGNQNFGSANNPDDRFALLRYLGDPGINLDFDGDGKTDVSVYRPSDGNWYMNRSTDGFGAIHWGGAVGDVIVPGDYDGDLKTDFAIWRPSDTPNVTDFYILNSNGFTVSGYSHGATTDIPVTGDYDGDGKADIAVWRPSTGTWYLWGSLSGTTTSAQFGATGDVPMATDSDADGKANLAVFRPGNNTWYIAKNTGVPAQNFTATQWGIAGDVLVPADYDGDGKADAAVFRPSNGVWYIRQSTNGVLSAIQFGASGDVPVPGDYDGDGTADTAVFRNGVWYINGTTAGFSAQAFGLSTDSPVPSAYHP